MNKGFVLDNRYEYMMDLGCGSNGSVYLVYDNKLNKKWAVKVCSHFSEQEIYALKQINYYFFPRIVDVIVQDEHEYLIMDYIEGETLSVYCQTHALPEKQAIIMCKEIACALHYLHNMTPSIIYADLKPDNIIITPSGEARIIDFGSIYVDTIKSNAITGTTFYAPAELSTSVPTIASDIYSFGMTMYRILTGQRKELRNSKGILLPERINRNISISSVNIIKRCTLPSPSERYHSMNDIIRDLTNFSQSRRKLFFFNTTSSCPSVLCKPFCFFPFHRNGKVSSWETTKEIIKLTLCLLAVLATFFSFLHNIKSVPSSKERLDITLYDKNCKLLVRPGATWEVDEDITLSLSKDELLSTPSTVTITCANDSGTKSYSFQCAVR